MRTDPPAIRFLLHDLQSPINIGKCARTAEIYGIDLFVHDPRRVTRNAAALRTIHDFSCGAWERRAGRPVGGADEVLARGGPSRLVATCLRPDAVRLRDFRFRDGDVVVFGNEYDGVPDALIDRADEKLYIAMPDVNLPKPRSIRPIDRQRSRAVHQNGVPNLNVAVSLGIVAYEYACWLESMRTAA